MSVPLPAAGHHRSTVPSRPGPRLVRRQTARRFTFPADFLAQVSLREIQTIVKQFAAEYGNPTGEIAEIERQGNISAKFRVNLSRSYALPISIHVRENEPHLISGLFFETPIAISASLESVVKEFAAKYENVSAFRNTSDMACGIASGCAFARCSDDLGTGDSTVRRQILDSIGKGSYLDMVAGASGSGMASGLVASEWMASAADLSSVLLWIKKNTVASSTKTAQVADANERWLVYRIIYRKQSGASDVGY